MPFPKRGASSDHPRVCGEQIHVFDGLGLALGSPPRVRGTGDDSPNRRWKRGITPACAGNRNFPSTKGVAAWDHPRVCGEQQQQSAICRSSAGSPPRVRGTGGRRATVAGCGRITPACAGNSSIWHGVHRKIGDHPRVCGEQLAERTRIPTSDGSPPRVRGTVLLPDRAAFAAGITPACAGNSEWRSIHGLSE